MEIFKNIESSDYPAPTDPSLITHLNKQETHLEISSLITLIRENHESEYF
jgi:hypothetical protein